MNKNGSLKKVPISQMENKFYMEINKALQSYENYKPYHTKSLDWISSRISWCWKWKKITKDQMEELCNRVITIFERN